MCSAAETMLLSGVLQTMTPFWVAYGDVDVVESRAGPADDAKIGGRVEELLVDERLAADDDAVVLGDDREHLLG